MVSGSRAALAASLAVLLWICPGCLSGHAIELGRIHESVLRYERAFSNDERLLLRYEVEIGDHRRTRLGGAQREVALLVDDLRAVPELEVGRFPIQPVRIEQALEPGDHELELVMGLQAPLAAQAVPTAQIGVMRLQIESRDGRHIGFRLQGGSPGGSARFRSGALYHSHLAWWVYPLLPFTAALDLALLLPQIVAVTPLFLAGE